MGWQYADGVACPVVAGKFADMDRELFVVMDIDLGDPFIGFDIAETGPFIAADFPGEDNVFRCDRHAVAPYSFRPDRVSDGQPFFAILRLFDLRRTIL